MTDDFDDVPVTRDPRRADDVAPPPDKTLAVLRPTLDLRVLPPAMSQGRSIEELWPVWDQRPLLTCTAHAAAGIALYERIRKRQTPHFEPSRRFIYRGVRDLAARHPDRDAPGTVRWAMKALSDPGMCADAEAEGVPREAVWSYGKDFPDDPPESCLEFARVHRVLDERYYLNADLRSLLDCLAGFHPFTICFDLYDSYYLPETKTTGDIPMPGSSGADKPTGAAHAVVVCGYDRPARKFLIRNSYGTGWGKGGYGTIPFDFVTDTALCDSRWTLRPAKPA